MYVTVHRGTQQIGGNLIETGTGHTRLHNNCLMFRDGERWEVGV